MITSNQSAFRKINKLFFQYQSDRNIECYRDDRSSYRNNNNNSHQKRNDRLFRMNIITKIEKKFERNERNFKKNDIKIYDKSRINRNRDRYKFNLKKEKSMKKNKDKAKAFLSAENSAEIDDLKNFHQNENFTYYNSDYDENDDYIESNITVSLIVAMNIICRQCKAFFQSNNAFHKHLKCCLKEKIENNNITTIYVETVSTNSNTLIRRSDVDVNKNVETDYDFKEWQYASAEIVLNSNMKVFSECLNTSANITLANIKFVKAQCKNLSIKTMISFITVRDLNVNRHSTNKYVILSMYFSDKNKDENFVKILIIREIHLIDDLKANIFIENDVLNSKKFDIFISTSSVYIENCDVTISIFVKNRSIFRTASIHATKFV